MGRQLICTAALLAAILWVAGCGSQKGKTVFTAGPNSGTVVGTAPDTATYKLYTATGETPVMTIQLKQGDKLGFQKASDGRIEAVYGEKTYDLSKETVQAYWKEEE